MNKQCNENYTVEVVIILITIAVYIQCIVECKWIYDADVGTIRGSVGRVNYCLFTDDCLNITEGTGFVRGKHGSIDFLS